MSDRGPLYDQKDTPEDVATLYSWANLHGAKYRDFSEARAQTREKARQRVQQAIDDEQVRLQRQAQMEHLTADVRRVTEPSHAEEQNHQMDWDMQYTTEPAVPEVAEHSAHIGATESVELNEPEVHVDEPQYSWQPMGDHLSTPAEPEAQQGMNADAEVQREYREYIPAQASWPGTETAPPGTLQSAPVQSAPSQRTFEKQAGTPVYSASAPAEQREAPARPAWLTPERSAAPAVIAPPRPAEDTLQGSRDRLASRWYALRGVFDATTSSQTEVEPSAPPAPAPVVAAFSLAGGVGKTCLVSTLGRALSGRGERVLLVDTAPYGLMPFYFGAHDQRPGMLRTFSPPGTIGDAPIQLITLDPETLVHESSNEEAIKDEIGKYSRHVGRIVVDLATASGATARRVLSMSPLVLVPLLPDMNSVVSVSSVDSFFQHNVSPNSKQIMPYYILNQFDSSLPLHLDVREILREQLGDRLLTVALRRSPAVSEALAEGMTVMDYAPNSTVAEDFATLAGWVKSQSAPASSAFRGVRWSER